MKIGVISDTHGRLHPRVAELFSGVEHILHAGDIGAEAVLEALRELAPVTAVRGNVDDGGPCARYPEEAHVTLGNHRFMIVHQVKEPLDRLRAGTWPDAPEVLVYGHSHRGAAERVGGTLLFNPGSAGPRRFRLIPSVGLLEVSEGHIHPRLLALEPKEQEALASA